MIRSAPLTEYPGGRWFRAQRLFFVAQPRQVATRTHGELVLPGAPYQRFHAPPGGVVPLETVGHDPPLSTGTLPGSVCAADTARR
ncbi:hypothetical protein [Segeticoccus rhizosphaerae]|uniref:hypothetical protein n=1 Tax=Segeticoccus rhizosphaerae TaxID=1104777 RepID=UPI001265607D|nr:hypothetical protein [Segeticoccus rhizosphaerae]